MRTEQAEYEPRIGESHDVEVERVEPVGTDRVVIFRDLERRHRRYVEVMSENEFADAGQGTRGTIVRATARSGRSGRWAFTAAAGESGS